MLAQSTLLSDLTRINCLLKSCSETAAKLQQSESADVQVSDSGSGGDVPTIATAKYPITSGDVGTLPTSTNSTQNEPSSPPKGILKRPSEESLLTPTAIGLSGHSAGLRKFAQRLLPRNMAALPGEKGCYSTSEKPSSTKRVTFSLDCASDTGHLVDGGNDLEGAVGSWDIDDKEVTAKEQIDPWCEEDGSTSGNKEQNNECNESNKDVVAGGCVSKDNVTNGSTRNTIQYNNSVNIGEQVGNSDDVFELKQEMDRSHVLKGNDQRNSATKCSSLGHPKSCSQHRSLDPLSSDDASTPVLGTPIRFASIVEIIHSDVISGNCSSELDQTNAVTSEGGEFTSFTDETETRWAPDDGSRGELTSGAIRSEAENAFDHGDGELFINGQHDDGDDDDDDDDTMVVHDVQENDVTVCQNSFGHFMSHMFEGIGEQSKNNTVSAVQARTEPDGGGATVGQSTYGRPEGDHYHSNDNINKEAEDTKLANSKEREVNVLQTFDREQMTADRGTYSRMYLRQFKSNIYKGRKWPTKSPEVHRQVSLDTEESDSPAPLPTPPPTPLVNTPYEQNRLLQKLDHISDMLNQINTGGALNSPKPDNETLTRSGSKRPGQSAAIFQYGDVHGASSPSAHASKPRAALKQILYFTIAVLLYLLSVLALLAITFPRLDISIQHCGIRPI